MDERDRDSPAGAGHGRTELQPADGDGIRQGFPPWGWQECMIGVGIAIVVLVVIAGVLSAIVPNGNAHPVKRDLAGLAGTLLLEVVLFGIAVGMTVARFGGGLRVLGWRPRMPDGWLGWSFLALVLSWVTLGIYYAITSALGLHDLQPKSNVPKSIFDHRQTVVVATILTVVVAPVCEETFFRGFLFNGLRRSLGFSAAAAASGVLFALAHATTSLVIPFAIIGVIFAYVYRRTGTLWTNVTTHVLFNSISVVITIGSRQ